MKTIIRVIAGLELVLGIIQIVVQLNSYGRMAAGYGLTLSDILFQEGAIGEVLSKVIIILGFFGILLALAEFMGGGSPFSASKATMAAEDMPEDEEVDSIKMIEDDEETDVLEEDEETDVLEEDEEADVLEEETDKDIDEADDDNGDADEADDDKDDADEADDDKDDADEADDDADKDEADDDADKDDADEADDDDDADKAYKED